MKAGVTVQSRAMLYKLVLQTVLLYCNDNWVVVGAIMKMLEGFHHLISRRIPGNNYWRIGGRFVGGYRQRSP